MAKIKHTDPINAAIEMRIQPPDPDRGYLGLSQVGHECARSVWYAWSKAPRDSIKPRTRRIWEQGDFQETQMVRDLKAAGYKVWGEQDEIRILDGAVQGHIDGRILGVPDYEDIEHLLELKSMAETYFKELVKKGLYKSHKPYWVQAQLYAHYLGLDWILVGAVNKNTEGRHFERIPAEPERIQKYIDRMYEIIAAEDPPDRVGGPSYFLCKFFCNYGHICHEI